MRSSLGGDEDPGAEAGLRICLLRPALTLKGEAGIHRGLREVRLIRAGAILHHAHTERDRRPWRERDRPPKSIAPAAPYAALNPGEQGVGFRWLLSAEG